MRNPLVSLWAKRVTRSQFEAARTSPVSASTTMRTLATLTFFVVLVAVFAIVHQSEEGINHLAFYMFRVVSYQPG